MQRQPLQKANSTNTITRTPKQGIQQSIPLASLITKQAQPQIVPPLVSRHGAPSPNTPRGTVKRGLARGTSCPTIQRRGGPGSPMPSVRGVPSRGRGNLSQSAPIRGGTVRGRGVVGTTTRGVPTLARGTPATLSRGGAPLPRGVSKRTIMRGQNANQRGGGGAAARLPLTKQNTFDSMQSAGVATKPASPMLGEIRKNSMLSSSAPVISQKNDDFMWKLTVMSGTSLIAKDLNGKSDPYVVVELITASMVKGKWKHIKPFNKTQTPVAEETLHPMWNFQAYLLPGPQTFEKYQGVRFTCMDKDLVGTDDFMGQGYLMFGKDIPATPTTKQFVLTLESRPKKKDKVSGFLTITSSFLQSSAPSSTETSRSLQPLTKDTAQLKSAAVKRSELVQVSATGRREIKHVNTQGGIITFGELPPFDPNVPTPTSTVGHRFDSVVALWMVTCCQLSYRTDAFIGEVARNVWDMHGYKFLDNPTTDTQGFMMHNDQIIVICFRGTESIRDWLTNFNFILMASPQFPARYLKAGVRVHTGFNEALCSVWGDVKEFVDRAYKTYPRLRMYICGHSLGGALANLCFGFTVLSDTPRPVAAVYTVGQPRVGNKKFKEQLELNAPDTPFIRITNNQDCVPSLAGGQHCGFLVHIKANGDFCFDPPSWQKAVNKAQAMQGSAASLSYAGIADHGTVVYRKRIENHWLKSQFAQYESGDGAFDLCEQTLFVLDFLTEDIKSVRRYKPQFRAIVRNVIECRPLIVSVQEYISGGVDAKSRQKLQFALSAMFDSLSKLRKEVLARQSKQSILQQVGSSEKAFNSEMTKLCKNLQKFCDDLHRVMLAATISGRKVSDKHAWVTDVPEVVKYTGKGYNIAFTSINFDQITASCKVSSSEGEMHVSKMLEIAEEMIEEGKYKQALGILENLMDDKSGVVGTLGPEDEALAGFLSAQAHAKLHNHQAAINSLQSVSNHGMMSASIMDNKAFATLRDNASFKALKTTQQTKKPALDMTASLNNFEIHALTRVFDDADANGDNYLTTQEFCQLLTSVGGLGELLDSLGWNEGTNKQPILNSIISDIRTKYKNAADLDQFISLMSRLMPV